MIACGQFTIRDENDIWVGPVPPENPIIDELWLDTLTVPAKLKRWTGQYWEVVGNVDEDLEDLNGKVTEINTSISGINIELDKIVQRVSSTESDIETNNLSIKDAKELAIAMAKGKPLKDDPAFKDGLNGVIPYSKTATGITITRITKPKDCPTTSSHALEVKIIKSDSVGFGGFSCDIKARANAKFLIKIIAKIPTGRTLAINSDGIGSGGSDKMYTQSIGLNRYAEYIRQIKCGNDGTFSSCGAFYMTGGSTPSSANPINIQIATLEVFDATDVDYTLKNTVEEVNKVKDRTGTLEVNVNSITGRVESVESTTNTIGGQVIDQEIRLSAAEQKITDDAIISTVSKTISDAVGVVDEKVSSLKQTTDEFQFKITNNGYYNILKNSRPRRNLSNWWVSFNNINGNNAYITEHQQGENFEGETFNSGFWFNGTQRVGDNIWNMVCNDSIITHKFNTQKKHCIVFPIYSDYESAFEVWIADANSTNVVFNTTHIDIYRGYKWVELTFTPRVQGNNPVFIIKAVAGDNNDFSFYVPWVNIYEGEIIMKKHLIDSTGYREGITTIDNDGVKVQIKDGDGESGYTRVDNEGVSTYDRNGNRKAWFGEGDTAYIKELSADKINNRHLIKWSENRPYNFYISPSATGDGTGRDQHNKSNSFNHTLNWIWNTYGCYSWQKNMNFYFDAGTYHENWYIGGWLGTGEITIELPSNSRVYGSHRIEENQMYITITGHYTHDWNVSGAEFYINENGADDLFYIRSSNVAIRRCTLYRSGWAYGYGDWSGYIKKAIYATNASTVFTNANDIIGFYYSHASVWGSTVCALNNRGHAGCGMYISAGAEGRAEGYYTINHYDYVADSLGVFNSYNLSPHNSKYAPKQEYQAPPPPPPPPPPEYSWAENSWTASNLRTIPEGAGNPTSERYGMWGQGNWSGNKANRGYADLGDGPNNWCHGGRNFTVWITLRRISSGGYAGSVPVPSFRRPDGSFWSSEVSFARGETKTIQFPGDIGNAIAEGGMKTLQLWVGKSETHYTHFDYTTIKIRCEKRT